MAAYDTGKMILFVWSVLWDLEIPQEAALVVYEDNDTCTTSHVDLSVNPFEVHKVTFNPFAKGEVFDEVLSIYLTLN
jgi:hypothetical protein